MWCNGLDLEEWEDSCNKEESDYLHGHCDEWVLKNYQNGDIPVIWNEFNEEIGKVCLVHCYIIRNGKYIDIRGETDNLKDTFLFDNKVCMLIDRNGHSFPINLETGKMVNIKPSDELVRISCELQYKVE